MSQPNHITRYHNLTDAELLREVDELAHSSPIVRELQMRLEKFNNSSKFDDLQKLMFKHHSGVWQEYVRFVKQR